MDSSGLKSSDSCPYKTRVIWDIVSLYDEGNLDDDMKREHHIWGIIEDLIVYKPSVWCLF